MLPWRRIPRSLITGCATFYGDVHIESIVDCGDLMPKLGALTKLAIRIATGREPTPPASDETPGSPDGSRASGTS